jgi:hypothetical protein
MNWIWNTAPLSLRDTCCGCQQPLRLQQGTGIVTWTDSKHYHVECLLDRLASPARTPAVDDMVSVSHWGLLVL